MLPKSYLILFAGLSVLAMQPGYGEPPPVRQEKAANQQGGASENSLPPGALVRLGDARFRAGGGAVMALAFSPNDESLISVDGIYEPAAARFWDVANGRLVREVNMSKSKSGHMAVLSPDQRLVAWEAKSDVPRGDDDKPRPPESVNVIDIWELKSGQRLHRLQTPGRAPHSFSFSPDAKMLASRHTGGVIVLWDCATGRKIKQLQAPVVDPLEAGSRGWVAWSPTGKVLAAAQVAGYRRDASAPAPGSVIHFWTVPDGHCLDTSILFNDFCFGLSFSPDGKRLAVFGDKTLLIAETATAKALHKLSLRGPKPKVAFSANGKLLAATDSRSSGDGESFKQWDDIWLVDLSADAKARRLPVKPHNITALAFSPDGKTLATGSYGSEIRLWDAATGKEKAEAAAELGGCIAFSRDGKTVAAGDWSGGIRLFDAQTGREVGKLPGKKNVHRLRFSPDGRLLAAVGGARDGLCLWNVAKRKLLEPYDGERWKEALLPAFSPDGRTMAVCFGLNYNRTKPDKDTRLYEVGSGKEIRRLKGELDNVAFSSDGKLLAGGCRTDGDGSRHDSGIRLWDAASGKLLREYAEMREFASWNPESLAFTPDDRQLIAWHRPRFGHHHKLVSLELTSGKPRWEIDKPFLSPHLFGTNVAVTPDGRIAAVANADTAIDLYRLDTGKMLGQLTGHRGVVVDVAFAPDGKRLASVSSDKTALIWDMKLFLEKMRPRREQQWSGDKCCSSFRSLRVMNHY